ncbi:MAG: hypothetical protein M9933_18195 [Chitinophagaceae bacterium]|nr:hypothetical protein [Chitinophagaceae bacterium]
MKKILVFTALVITINAGAYAQKEYRMAKTGGKLVLNNISNLQVEGYDGKEIIFTRLNNEGEDNLFRKNESSNDDPRA